MFSQRYSMVSHLQAPRSSPKSKAESSNVTGNVREQAWQKSPHLRGWILPAMSLQWRAPTVNCIRAAYCWVIFHGCWWSTETGSWCLLKPFPVSATVNLHLKNRTYSWGQAEAPLPLWDTTTTENKWVVSAVQHRLRFKRTLFLLLSITDDGSWAAWTVARKLWCY